MEINCLEKYEILFFIKKYKYKIIMSFLDSGLNSYLKKFELIIII